uniref:Uncharacterized protein n=1 Tax=Anguilla anguilla TaxID=7936 RepID=A0A0E9QXF9_ANGAN
MTCTFGAYSDSGDLFVFMFPVLHPSNRGLTRNDSPLCFAAMFRRYVPPLCSAAGPRTFFSRVVLRGWKCGLGFAGGGCVGLRTASV